MIKVYTFGFWHGWDLNKVFVDFKYPILKKYNLVQSSEKDADVILFSHYNTIDRSQILSDESEPLPITNTNAIKVFFSLENWGHPSMNRCDYAITSRMDFDHPRHFALPHCITYVDMWKDILLAPREVPDKPKFCSYMASNPIQFRQEFFDILSQYKFIEAAGACRTNVPKLPHNEKAKMDYIGDFKFNLAFENSCSPGYICEKHVQPMTVGSVPIYLGAPNIGDYFDTRSFLNWELNESRNSFIERIKRVDQDNGLYKSLFTYPFLKDNKINYNISTKKVEDVFDIIFKGL